MHLKNFSLYQPQKEVVTLTPGYDMLSTALVMPEDKEELGLTLNGKKRKIKIADFQIAMRNTGLEDKIIQNIFVKFTKALDSWLQWVDISFLPADMKDRYKGLLKEKVSMIEKSDYA